MAIRAPGWWQARSLREKRLLLAAAALSLFVLAWFLLVRPLMEAQTTATARLDAAVSELALARAEADSLKQQAREGTAGGAVPVPIAPFLTQSAAEQGFTNASVSPSTPNRASITIPQARAPVLFGWVAQLEGRGLVIESLAARANSDQTVAAELIVRAGGS